MKQILGAVLLIAVGVGIGLWLGISPTGREQVEKAQTQVSSITTSVETTLKTQVRPFGAQEQAQSDASSERPEAKPGQETNVLTRFWEATQRLFASLMARFEFSS